jgi:hypothetical protein
VRTARGKASNRFAPRVFGILIAWVALLGVLASCASAAECTDTWIGPAEGPWQTVANWSAGHVPTEADIACIGAGKTARVESLQSVGVVQGEGGIIATNVLNLTRPPSEAVSTIGYLTLTGGSLNGAGTVEVANAFVATNGTLAGTGSTVLGSGTIGLIEGMTMNRRTLVNSGSLLCRAAI